VRPAPAADGAPHRRFTQLLALVLRPPRAVLQHRGVRCRLQPLPQHHLLLESNATRVARNGLTLQRARLALLHDSPFDCGHRHSKAASGFSHGQTLSHRSHQAFFQVGRIRTHISLSHTTCACLCFSQVALSALSLACQADFTFVCVRTKVMLQDVWSDPKCTDAARRCARQKMGNAYIYLCTSSVCIVSGLFPRAERIYIPVTRKITQLALVWRLTI
jgi:hypothetical protein